MRYWDFLGETITDNASKLDLTNVETMRATLKRLSRPEIEELQTIIDELALPPKGTIEVYHGTPNSIAALIRSDGFQLTKGQRSGFLGARKTVDNLGIFLTDDKGMADFFGQNRADHRNDYEIIHVYINPTGFLDADKATGAIKKIGLDLLQREDGKSRTKIPKQEWSWLLDRSEFVDAIKAQGYRGVRFKETMDIQRLSQSRGHTYFVIDPKDIVIRRPPMTLLYEYLKNVKPA